MTTPEPTPSDEPLRRDRREHGGAPAHPDDDALAERTEAERVDAGLEDYDPDQVPAATDSPTELDITDTPEYQDEAAEVNQQLAAGELRTEGDDRPFPPSGYDRS